MDGEIDPERVDGLRDDDTVDLCLVDIRNAASFDRGHIPGSLNVPLPELTGRIESLPDADRVITVCPKGESSVQAARLIASYEGVDAPVESMAGGLIAYDGELETGSENAGNGDHAGDERDGTNADEGPQAPF